ANLEDLRHALAAILAAHPEIQVGSLQTKDAEFITLLVEPAEGPKRSLRAAPGALGDDDFFIRWSAYRSPPTQPDTAGGTYGDLACTLSAIQHWIVEGRPHRQVPEFDPAWVAAHRGH